MSEPDILPVRITSVAQVKDILEGVQSGRLTVNDALTQIIWTDTFFHTETADFYEKAAERQREIAKRVSYALSIALDRPPLCS